MARMFTRELTEESIKVSNADPAHLERAKLLTGTMILRALDTPDGKDVLIAFTFDKGKCTDWSFEEEAAPSDLRDRPFTPMQDGLARVTASYQTFVKLDRGEIVVADALNSPDYKIEGNMMLLLPLMQAVESFNQKIRALPKEY